MQPRYAHWADSRLDGSWVWNPAEGTVHINARAAQLLGCERHALRPVRWTQWLMLLSPADAVQFEVATRMLLGGKPGCYQSEVNLHRADGGTSRFWLRAECRSDGRVHGSLQDVGFRMDEEMRIQHSPHHHSAQRALDWVVGWQFDLQEQRLSGSPQFLNWLGIAPGEPVRVNDALTRIQLESQGLLKRVLRHTVRSGVRQETTLHLHSLDGDGVLARCCASVQRENGHAVRLNGALAGVAVEQKSSPTPAHHRPSVPLRPTANVSVPVGLPPLAAQDTASQTNS